MEYTSKNDLPVQLDFPRAGRMIHVYPTIVAALVASTFFHNFYFIRTNLIVTSSPTDCLRKSFIFRFFVLSCEKSRDQFQSENRGK